VTTALTLPNREAWRIARRAFIGASDAAAVWGCSGYQSPYSCWFSKVGPMEPDQPDIVQRVGHAMEPLIAEMFFELTGVPLVDHGDFTVFRHSEIPCMGCTPDRMTADGSAVVELKTAHFAAADEWKERIPLSYQTQLQHQMIVMGVERAFIAVLIASTTFKHHEMRLSPGFAKRHIAKCLAFWRQYVETQTAPPPDWSQATSQALARQFNESRRKVVDLPRELDGLGERYDRISKFIGAAERHQNEIKNRVKAAMGENELGRLPSGDGFAWAGKNGSRRFTRKAKEIHDP
jgi:putative phage-type endonuclease